jgi:hypothetical protein
VARHQQHDQHSAGIVVDTEFVAVLAEKVSQRIERDSVVENLEEVVGCIPLY